MESSVLYFLLIVSLLVALRDRDSKQTNRLNQFVNGLKSKKWHNRKQSKITESKEFYFATNYSESHSSPLKCLVQNCSDNVAMIDLLPEEHDTERLTKIFSFAGF